jgi:hypothetical protein
VLLTATIGLAAYKSTVTVTEPLAEPTLTASSPSR